MRIEQLKDVIRYLESCGNSNERRARALQMARDNITEGLVSIPGLPGEFFRALDEPSSKLVSLSGAAEAAMMSDNGGGCPDVEIVIEHGGSVYKLVVTLEVEDGLTYSFDEDYPRIWFSKPGADEGAPDHSKITDERLAEDIGGFCQELIFDSSYRDILPSDWSPLSASQWLAWQAAFDCSRTALHTAAEYNAVNLAVDLLDFGVDRNAVDENGETALHAAANPKAFRVSFNGAMEMVEVLIDRGVDPERKDSHGNTFLDKIKDSQSEAMLSDSQIKHIVSLVEDRVLKLKKMPTKSEIDGGLGL